MSCIIKIKEKENKEIKIIMYKTVNQGDNIKIQKIKINGKKGQMVN